MMITMTAEIARQRRRPNGDGANTQKRRCRFAPAKLSLAAAVAAILGYQFCLGNADSSSAVATATASAAC